MAIEDYSRSGLRYDDEQGFGMSASPIKSILITGANTGLGKDLARRLAVNGEFGKIYLGCRSGAKGASAKADLQNTTGRDAFDVVLIDVADPASVRRALGVLDRPLDTLVMNAGGTGGTAPMALTADGVTEIFASNVLGHVVLLEGLLAEGALTGTAVLTGSEAARGVRQLRIPRPTFASHSVDEFASVIDGSYFAAGKANAMAAYGQVKYLAALWMSATARKHPELRILTMSPGNTSGTEAMRDLPPPLRIIAQRLVFPHVLPALGLAHPLETGSGRLAAAVTDPALRSGAFYASAANKLTGPVIDQAEIVPDFRDTTIQDHADEAIHRYTTQN
jgi:NAD(P)-dependent dehydrogenase (short-subunit alcohol dehydrogenase family)